MMTNTRVVLSILFAGLVVTTLIVACAGGEEPTEVPVPPPGVTGADLLQERCTACHGLNRVEGESETQAEWEATVERMREYGAELTDEEAQMLVDYLVENYGP
jgi:mono/diheme cytochrome c family protein